MTERKKPKSILKYALWLTDRKPYSVEQMRRALRKRGFDEDEVEPALQTLVDWRALDDAQYKDYVLRSRKLHNVRGRAGVRQELQRAGVDNDDLDELYSDEEEQALIAALIDKWQRQGVTYTRPKYFRRLATRGFAPGNIFAVLPENGGEDEADEDF